MRDQGVSEILIVGFALGMLWDFITAFLGVISIIGGKYFTISLDNLNPNTFGIYGIALVISVMVFCFNLITEDVWKEAKQGTWTLFLLWFPCIVFDFMTSLEGNYKYILPSRKDEIAVIGVIWFTTLVVTISPMGFRYLVRNYSNRP